MSLLWFGSMATAIAAPGWIFWISDLSVADLLPKNSKKTAADLCALFALELSFENRQKGLKSLDGSDSAP